MDALHTHVIYEERLVICDVFSEVYYQFFCFCGVENEGRIVGRAPLGQGLDFLPVGGLIPARNESHHNSVICKLNDRIGGKC